MMGTEKNDLPRYSKEKKKLKRQKAREERNRIKQQLERGEDPQDGYGKYKGWAW